MYIFLVTVKNFNRGEIMNKIIKYSMYAVALFFMALVVVSYNTLNKEETITGNIPVDYDYVTDIITSEIRQVNKINESNVIIRPYFEQEVEIVKSFYDYKSDEKTQEEEKAWTSSTPEAHPPCSPPGEPQHAHQRLTASGSLPHSVSGCARTHVSFTCSDCSQNIGFLSCWK